MKKRIPPLLLAGMFLFCTACGPAEQSPETGNPADTGQSAAQESKQEINVCLASEPATLDPALNSSADGATLCAHLFAGLAKWTTDENGQLVIVPDLAEYLPIGIRQADGSVTYKYTIRSAARWSDGQQVTADDFVFAWNRAASPELAADYSTMFEVIRGYDQMWAEGGSGQKLAVTALDERTLQVTLDSDISYWNELLAFPAYYPLREDIISEKGENWATDPDSYISNGAYTLTSWDHNSVITVDKNPEYFDAKKVTMDTIHFYLSDDQNNMLSNFQNGAWQFIDDVPTNEIANLKESNPDEFHVNGQLGTYYVCWNVNAELLPVTSPYTGADRIKAENEIRSALALVIDRNYIVDSIAQGGQVPASSFVAMGMTDYDGSQFYKNAGNTPDCAGYYDVRRSAYQSNWDKAVETLKKYYDYDEASGRFTDFPPITYLYNNNETHKAIAENIQGIFASLGITMNLENQEWATFLETRKSGDFTIARNGWVADYNDPISFLDMWTSASGNNDVQFGKGENAGIAAYSLDCSDLGVNLSVMDGTWAETYDALISVIKSTEDAELRYRLMHRAEDLLMETGCITPIFFYTDIYMLSDQVNGFFANPLGYKFFMKCTYK